MVKKEKKKPNYDYWRKVDGVEPWQAIHLLYDEQPIEEIARYNEDENDSYVIKDHDCLFDDEQSFLYDLVKIAVNSGIFSSSPLIRLNEFYKWAKDKGYPTKDRNIQYSENLFECVADEKDQEKVDHQQTAKTHNYMFRKISRESWEFAFGESTTIRSNHLVGYDYIRILLSMKDKRVSCSELVRIFSDQVHHTSSNFNATAEGLTVSNGYEKNYLDPDKFTLKQREILEKLKKLDISKKEALDNRESAYENQDKALENEYNSEYETLSNEFDSLTAKYKDEERKNKSETPEMKRSRQSVIKAITRAKKALFNLYPALGKHLQLAIHERSLCIYKPEMDIEWDIEGI